jgi:hypothetical protein
MSTAAISTLDARAQILRCQRFLRIGDVVLRLHASGLSELNFSAEVEQFRSPELKADIDVGIDWVDSLESASRQPDFDSGAVWCMFRDGSDLVFDFATPMLGPEPYKRMRVDTNFGRASVVLNRPVLAVRPSVYPLEYPTDELLITSFLGSGVGVEVHGCGLVDEEGRGHLFMGHSGAGKSTTTRLWARTRNPLILSDDRIILRLRDGALWMYGTPWHGEAAFASNARARVDRILILQHGAKNEFRLLPKAAATGELFARSFPPFHAPARLGSTIDFLDRALDNVPCYEYSFVPDLSAVQTVLQFHG